jgi:hypothetical protein
VDEESLKLGLLLETAQTHQKLIEALIEKLQEHTRGLDAVVRAEIRQALGEELAALEQQANAAGAALEAMRRAANWRQILLGGALAVLVAGITLGGFWLLTPSREEILRLRAERAQLQNSIDLLASHGGRADFKTCGVGNAHLCVRVEPHLGRYGDEKDYFVVKGY